MIGRPVSTWTSRKCRTCGIVYPRHYFEAKRAAAKNGLLTRPDCKACFRRRDRERKLEYYATNDAYRESCLAANRQVRARRDQEAIDRSIETTCRWAWFECKRDQFMALDAKPIVVCVRPSDFPPRKNQRPGQRRGKTLAFVLDKPPVEIPVGWVPILRKRGPIITKHPSCPAEWEWTEHILEMRYRAWTQKANEDAGQSDPPK